MKKSLTKQRIERYSRQIILKDIGVLGQKKIINSRVLIVGIGGLGSPVADLLARSGVGYIGAVDHDKIDISNLQRQILFTSKDIGKYKVDVFRRRIKLINKDVKVKILRERASENNLNKIIKNYNIIVDGTDNFKTKFLINKFSLKYKKKLIVGAISKFDGHIFSFDFNNKSSPCLKCFFQSEPSDEILNCETEGILGTTSNIIGSIQANEVLKNIISSDRSLHSSILIVNLKKLEFRKIKFTKKKNCLCN